ncbi:ABC transporter substrate-binding protein [Aeromicrobium yanjiei]|uniref:Putative aliphatic sulfonates-binding protein n=1 Tax=Aeromicrobium yanjiei TaxID=2662028 RepID=A0A5Q2MKD4_9ACTN|nr:ABC transporter substrate-binding protein [Aeromicrobium yanjiei]QGG40410.1 aliphatic sulfonate ABC transporter substrate-binding protein [Aeromicrobium yanjiei]
MKITRPAPVLAALGLVAALAACGGPSNADAVKDDGSVDLSKVSLVVGDQKGGSESLLKAAGELDDVPYDIAWKPFTSGPPLLDAVGGGSVDIGGVGNTPPLFAINEGKKVKVVHAAEQSAEGDAIVVPKDSPLTSVAALKGKKVAVAKGSSANYNLLAQLKDAGLSFSDIEPVYLQPTEALSAFRGNHVDAWAIWDPFTSQAEELVGARVLSTGEDLVNGLVFQLASDKALGDKATRAAIEDYLARLSRAQVWTNDHKDEWAQTWAKDTGLDPAVTARAIERRNFKPIPVPSAVESEQQMWDAFAAEKQLGASVDLTPYFVSTFDRSSLAAAQEETR